MSMHHVHMHMKISTGCDKTCKKEAKNAKYQRTLLKIYDYVIGKMIEEKSKVKPRQLLAVTTIKADHY